MKLETPFSVQVTSQNGTARLALRGELDMSVVDSMRETLATIEGKGESSIVLDLHDLTFIDSSGLHAILDAWRRAETNGHQLSVVDVNQAARRVFEITRTQFLIDETEAVSARGRSDDGHWSQRSYVATDGDRDV